MRLGIYRLTIEVRALPEGKVVFTGYEEDRAWRHELAADEADPDVVGLLAAEFFAHWSQSGRSPLFPPKSGPVSRT